MIEDEVLKEAVANVIITVTIGKQAHPKATDLLDALQGSMLSILAMTKGSTWLEDNDTDIGSLLQSRLSGLRDSVSSEAH